MRKVGITGLGVVTPFGRGLHPFEEGLRSGRSVLSIGRNIDTSNLRSSIVGEVDGRILSEEGFEPDVQRCLALAYLAAREALETANAGGGQIWLAVGSGFGEIRAFDQVIGSPGSLAGRDWSQLPIAPSVTAALALRLHVDGRLLTFANACSASCSAIATCFDLIRMGKIDVALAGGTEILSRPALAGFNSLHALAPNQCRPFDESREGTQLGEGAAFLLLESFDHARARGQGILAELAGYGASSDAFHPTRSDPEGRGPRVAMIAALDDAGLNPQDIDYINAHGTATFQNDISELNAIKSVFCERSRSIPISSTKSQLGHCLHACGAIELAASVLAIREQFLPPTLNLRKPLRGFEDFDFVLKPGRSAQLRHVMSNSFAFGGFNFSIIVSSLDR